MKLQNRIRSAGIGIGLIAASLFVTVLMLEIVLRLFYPQVLQVADMFRYSADFGWEFIPQSRGFAVYDGGAGHWVTTNSDGFRDDEFSITDPQENVVMVFGDSFVTNMAVGEKDVFTEVMQSHLDQTNVHNFGVNGYGQVQQFLLLERWFDRISPNLVVFLIYVRNDYYDNVGLEWRYLRPYATIDTTESSPQLHFPQRGDTTRLVDSSNKRWLDSFKKLHTYTFVGRRIRFLVAKYQSQSDSGYHKTAAPEIQLCRKNATENVTNMDMIMEKMILEMSDYCDNKGVRSILVIAPSLVQVHDDLWHQVIASQADNPDVLVRDLPNQKLLDVAQRNEMMMIDLLPVLHERCNGEDTCYNRLEQHWTSYANHLVADTLSGFITEKRLLPTPD